MNPSSPALALETSGRIGSVALAQSERVLAEEQFQHGLMNAAQMVPLVDRLCNAQGWKPADIQTVYVSHGPGSFTGLRIGITMAKTMALATGAKVVAVPTVNVLAENAPAEARELIVLLDAKRDQIFTARFVRAGQAWQAAEAAHLDDLAAMLSRAGRPVWLLGEGIPYHEKFIPDDQLIIRTPSECWRARAAVLARLGFEMAMRGEFTDADRLAPLYIRLPEAEEKARAAEGGTGAKR